MRGTDVTASLEPVATDHAPEIVVIRIIRSADAAPQIRGEAAHVWIESDLRVGTDALRAELRVADRAGALP